MSNVTDDLRNRVSDIMLSHGKIEACKLYAHETGSSLRQAKNYVDSLATEIEATRQAAGMTEKEARIKISQSEIGGGTLHLVNPTNDVRMVTRPFLWTLLFGGFYFIAHGIWTHTLISLLLAVPSLGISWFIYPFFARSVVLNHYLKMGWVEESKYQNIINKGDAPTTWIGARQVGQKELQHIQVIKVRCTKCAFLNDDYAKFCSKCGNILIQQSTTGQ